jgi:hypothetical protein
MQTFEPRKFHSFRADAHALGGFLKEPFEKAIATLAPVSLPAVGGFATARSGAFNLDEVVSCSSAYTLVTGRESRNEDAFSTLATAVIEDLNILEVVTAKRIVAQIALTIPKRGGRRISLAGSRIEGLRLAGRDRVPTLNAALSQAEGANHGHELPLTWENFRRTGHSQADTLVGGYAGRGGGASEWANSRFGWMTTAFAPPVKEGDPVLCSLVDGFEDSGPAGSAGHIVEIPGFGRIILMELSVSRDSVQLVSVRAELGCPVQGVVSGPTPSVSGGGGGTEN